MKLLNLCSIMFLLLGSHALLGQQTIATSGGTVVVDGASMAYSVGQPMQIAFSGTNGSVSEGVQSSIVITVLNTITGITDDFPEIKLSAFPNPTADKLTIQIENYVSQMNATLFDMSGIRLKRITINTSQSSLDLSDLKNSVYLLQMSNSDGYLKTFRIIKN
ncbi:MAG: T9SS type A sorting domain-containing protein [Reichenbachiella sp.]|uniref:T9SS type A sorting domain-containing protein n=1 Tax=Reichenbachiella sp. TaxID=2184521 RepID=UPI0032999EC1